MLAVVIPTTSTMIASSVELLMAPFGLFSVVLSAYVVVTVVVVTVAAATAAAVAISVAAYAVMPVSALPAAYQQTQ